jgi:hypothetical protein
MWENDSDVIPKMCIFETFADAKVSRYSARLLT